MQRIQDFFKKIIVILITHYDWSSDAQLLMRRVTIHAHYSESPLFNMINAVNNTLVESIPLPKKSNIYSTIRRRVPYFQSNIENYLSDDYYINRHEVIVLHGKFSKYEKGEYNQFFLNPGYPDEDNINVLYATSGVGNMGINFPHIINVF